MFASTTYSKISAYTNSLDCSSSQNSVSSFSIAANKNGTQIFYKFPTSTVGDTLSFRVNQVSLATTLSAYVPVTLRDSTANSFWIASYSQNRVSSGVCVRANFNAQTYAGQSKYLSVGTYAFVPLASGTNSSNLIFYSNDTCTTTAFGVSAGVPNNAFYFKYTGAEVDSNYLNLSISHSTDPGNGTADDIPHSVSIDRSGDITAKMIAVMGPNRIMRGSCNMISITSNNQNGSLLSKTLASVTLATTHGGRFYSSSTDCSADQNILSATSLNSTYKDLYFRTTAAPGVEEVLSVTQASNSLQGKLTTQILNQASKLKAFVNAANSFSYPAAGGCIPFNLEVKLSDTVNDGTYYTNNFGTSVAVQVTLPAGYTAYTNGTCDAGASSSLSLNISNGTYTSGNFAYYIKADSTPGAGVFSFYTPANPSYNIDSDSVFLAIQP